MHTVRVVDWAKNPGGRKRLWGPHSAEEFRDDVLTPVLEKHDLITVDMDGCAGFAGSFLDEVFGELSSRISPAEFRRRVVLVCTDDPSTVDDVNRCVAEREGP